MKARRPRPTLFIRQESNQVWSKLAVKMEVMFEPRVSRSGQGDDDHVRFIVQSVATKEPVSSRVDATPRPDFGAEQGHVLLGQFTTPGGRAEASPPAAAAVAEEEDHGGDEYRPDYADPLQLSGPDGYVKASVVPVPVPLNAAHELSGDPQQYEQPANAIDVHQPLEAPPSEGEGGQSHVRHTLRYPKQPRPQYNSRQRPRPSPSYFGIPSSISSLFSFFPGSTRAGPPYPAPPPRPPPPRKSM